MGGPSAGSFAGAAVRVRYRAVGSRKWSSAPSGTVRTNGAARIAAGGIWSGPTADRGNRCARPARTGATGSPAARVSGSGTGSGCGGGDEGIDTGREERRGSSLPDPTRVASSVILHDPMACADAGNAPECHRKDRSDDAEQRTQDAARGSRTMEDQTKLADSEIVVPVTELTA